MDFAGLGNLRGQASQKNGKATKETATQFEAMMIQMMLKSMRESIEKDDLMGNSEATKTFEEMYDKELSVAMAKKGSMGVADMLVKHINQA
ncbi:MAG: Peptidoglycan hydrolase FlgJ, partial [Pseudomonadota bacterium]